MRNLIQPLRIELDEAAFHRLMSGRPIEIHNRRGNLVATIELSLPDDTRPFWSWCGIEGALRLRALMTRWRS